MTLDELQQECRMLVLASERRERELESLKTAVNLLTAGSRPLNRREAVALALLNDSASEETPSLSAAIEVAFKCADLFCRIADETEKKQ